MNTATLTLLLLPAVFPVGATWEERSKQKLREAGSDLVGTEYAIADALKDLDNAEGRLADFRERYEVWSRTADPKLVKQYGDKVARATAGISNELARLERNTLEAAREMHEEAKRFAKLQDWKNCHKLAGAAKVYARDAKDLALKCKTQAWFWAAFCRKYRKDLMK